MGKSILPCPECGGTTQVRSYRRRKNQHGVDETNPFLVRRYRQCRKCKKNFTTEEHYLGYEQRAEEWEKGRGQWRTKGGEPWYMDGAFDDGSV